MIIDLKRPVQTLPVYSGKALTVVEGVARGDDLTFADDLVLDDVYCLEGATERKSLTVGLGPRLKTFRVQDGSSCGTPGNAVHLDSCITLMGADGVPCEALILVEVEDGMAADVYLLPIGNLIPDLDYRLVSIDRHAATRRFAQVACVSFGAGTQISMSDGSQRAIEDLRPGDMILTRDNGPRPLRWIGHTTLRAQGSFAPVVIRAGALNNTNDLTVSADHRILVYQREDKLGAGRSEVMVKVRHLIDGENVIRREGGHVDLFQLLFDEHEIIYAEGIASESLLVNSRTREVLPDDLARSVSHFGENGEMRVDYEVTEDLLSKPDALALLRKASAS